MKRALFLSLLLLSPTAFADPSDNIVAGELEQTGMAFFEDKSAKPVTDDETEHVIVTVKSSEIPFFAKTNEEVRAEILKSEMKFEGKQADLVQRAVKGAKSFEKVNHNKLVEDKNLISSGLLAHIAKDARINSMEVDKKDRIQEVIDNVSLATSKPLLTWADKGKAANAFKDLANIPDEVLASGDLNEMLEAMQATYSEERIVSNAIKGVQLRIALIENDKPVKAPKMIMYSDLIDLSREEGLYSFLVDELPKACVEGHKPSEIQSELDALLSNLYNNKMDLNDMTSDDEENEVEDQEVKQKRLAISTDMETLDTLMGCVDNRVSLSGHFGKMGMVDFNNRAVVKSVVDGFYNSNSFDITPAPKRDYRLNKTKSLN